jgi:nitrogen fixation NifU-like protein
MLSEKVKGLTVDEVMRLDKEAITTMVGIEFGPTRLRCALLPLEALQEGLSGLDA